MRRIVYQVNCPGCGRRIRAPSEDLRRQRVITHVRNCYAFRKTDAPSVPLDVVAPPQESIGPVDSPNDSPNIGEPGP